MRTASRQKAGAASGPRILFAMLLSLEKAMIHSRTSPIQSLLRVLSVWGLLGSLPVLGWAQPTGLREVHGRHERLMSLRILPPQPTLWGADATQRFLVLGQYANGLEREVTSRAILSVSDARIVTIARKGQLRGRANGTAVLEAQLNGHSVRVPVRVAGSTQDPGWSFQQEVGGILTRRGCNNSNCHGGVIGRGGFKLSLDATLPREDYDWIVRGGTYQVRTVEPAAPVQPRVNAEQPEKSLLLLKPTGAVGHGGGLRLEPESADYRALRDWIRRGAPFEGVEHPPEVGRLEVFPKESVLKTGEKQPILVTAHLANGFSLDFTDRVRYESLDRETLAVDSKGVVRARRPGEAAVMIRAAGGEVAYARVGVIEQPTPEHPLVPRNNFIDEYVFSKLKRFHVLPSPLASDEEFLRRVCLDIAGTLPPPHRVREFLADADPAKREKLIQVLLNSPEYTDTWTLFFADFLRVNGEYTWLHMYWEWVRSSVAQNKPYDQLAREAIAAQGYDGPTRGYLMDDYKPVPLERQVAEKFRVFMGRRLDCAQCHNHPFDRWTQDQFWGLAAYFTRLTNTEWASPSVVFDDPQGTEVDYAINREAAPSFVQAMHPRSKKVLGPRFFDGASERLSPRSHLRLELANRITRHPYFGEAFVNRIWARFLGRGLVDPADDFRLGNPPTHPELLSALARDFEEHGYDLKHLIGRIARSRTYQLASQTNQSNRHDAVNYSHARPRPLQAEILLDAIAAATGIAEQFQGEYPITGIAPPGTRAIQLKLPGAYASRFFDVYGAPLRKVVPERDPAARLTQSLHMMAGSSYNKDLSQPGSRLDRLLEEGATDRKMIEELYLAAFSRFPTAEEQAGLQQMIAANSSRRRALEDLVWALISSREFSENH